MTTYLILRQQRVADTCQEHHSHQERYHCFVGHCEDTDCALSNLMAKKDGDLLFYVGDEDEWWTRS